MKIFRYFSKEDWWMIFGGLVFVVIQVWLDLTMPDYMSRITLLVETEGSSLQEIFVNGLWMLACAVGSMAASFVTGYFAAKCSASISRNLRNSVFSKVLSFHKEEQSRFSTSSLITRTTNDITQVQTLVAMSLQAVIKAPILMVWAIAKIASRQWQWSVAVAGGVGLILITMLLILWLAVPRFTMIQNLTDSLNRIVRENLSGIRVVYAYNAEKYQKNKFETVNSELTDTNVFANRVLALSSPTMTFVTSALTLAIYWIGAALIENAAPVLKLDLFSEMVVYSSYAMQVIMGFTMLTMTIMQLPRVLVSIRRILEVLETQPSITNGTQRQGAQKGTVKFDHVFFAYPGSKTPILQDISFEAKPGQTIAIIGATASGKTTLVNLIPRFYDVSQGEVFVDGINVKDWDEQALRKRIGYAGQKATLFSGTIESNVCYGSEDQNTDLEKALEISHADEFVHAYSDQSQHPVAQGGTILSGGQKQRISIARAIHKDPEIYIFDDSFSALDYKTDKQVRNALNQETKDACKFLVTQRIAPVMDADCILVLKNGRLAGSGVHSELMKTCKTYRDIAYSQLSKEELEQYEEK